MSDHYWKPYVPVAKRRAKAQAQAKKAIASGRALEPIIIASRAIASTFWGKAWCKNLEAYSDYQNRLPRARTYVRNGSVIDLKILPGKVLAEVIGSRRYRIEINISALPDTQWQALVKDCTGSINSLIELLQGQFSEAVMQRICAPNTGLFPTPEHIHFVCSCPDWANMCKHVGATLYGVGARLDKDPQLLFTLRQVDANDLLSLQSDALTQPKQSPAASRVLSHDALSELFDIDMNSIDLPPVVPSTEAAPTAKQKTKAPTRKPMAAKKANTTKAIATKPTPKPKPKTTARKTRDKSGT